MYKIQSVIFDKKKFSLHLSKEWLKKHGYKDKGVDDKDNFYRFRQFNPASLKKQGYVEFRTKKLGKSGAEIIIAYKNIKDGGKISNDDLHHFIHSSYHKGASYKDWNIDPSLSDASVQVYFNGKDAVVVHRGSQDAQDWKENALTALGIKHGLSRLEHSRKIQKEAESKYGANNVITIGHSKGATHAEEVGQNSREIYTLNKPVTPYDLIYKKVPEKQTDIKTTFDPVSILRPLQQGNEYQNIFSKTLNPIKEHVGSVLNRINPKKMWGKGIMKEGGRCWKGYEPVPGRKPYSKGSCRKIKTGGALRSKSDWIKEVDSFIEILESNSRLGRGEVSTLNESLDDLDNYIGAHPNEIGMVELRKYIKLLNLIIEKVSDNQLINKAEDLVREYSFVSGGALSGGSFWSRLLNILRPSNRVYIDERSSREIYTDASDEVANFQRQPNGFFHHQDVNKIQKMLDELKTSFQSSTEEDKYLLFSFIRDNILNNNGFTPRFREEWDNWVEMMRETGRIPEDSRGGNEDLTPREDINISGRGRELGLSYY